MAGLLLYFASAVIAVLACIMAGVAYGSRRDRLATRAVLKGGA